MQKNIDELTIGVLDIYGFEIFQVQYLSLVLIVELVDNT